jgi:hypothetical protein
MHSLTFVYHLHPTSTSYQSTTMYSLCMYSLCTVLTMQLSVHNYEEGGEPADKESGVGVDAKGGPTPTKFEKRSRRKKTKVGTAPPHTPSPPHHPLP